MIITFIKDSTKGRIVSMRFFFVAPGLFFSIFCGAHPPPLFSISAGVFDVKRARYRTWELSGEVQLQYTSSYRVLNVRPIFGGMATIDGSSYLYGGINFDLTFDAFVLAPGFAAGWYRAGGGKQLGYPLEFRSCLELAWQGRDWRRIGIRLSHLSNAHLGHKNPGEESLVLFYSIPIKRGFPFK
jgi:lipid A 3-O-deacylase